MAVVPRFAPERFTIVHAHTPKAGMLAPLAARLAGVPIVAKTIHGFYFHERTPAVWGAPSTLPLKGLVLPVPMSSFWSIAKTCKRLLQSTSVGQARLASGGRH